MTARVIGYSEIEERFREIVMALEQFPMDEEFVLEKGAQLAFLLGVCLSQMSAPNSHYYPEKSMHLERLRTAQAAITFKLNTCTVDEVSSQITDAFKAFAAQ